MNHPSAGLTDYGSHFPILAGLVAYSVRTPRVLELGCGSYSTPLLHMLAKSMGGHVVSADSDAAWLSEYDDLREEWHELHHVPDWSSWDRIDEDGWDVAFVDHAPGERRPADILRLKNRARFIVVHDTEDEPGPRHSPCWRKAAKSGANYGYSDAFDQFKHVWHWGRFRPDTTVLSNFEPCPL